MQVYSVADKSDIGSSEFSASGECPKSAHADISNKLAFLSVLWKRAVRHSRLNIVKHRFHLHQRKGIFIDII